MAILFDRRSWCLSFLAAGVAGVSAQTPPAVLPAARSLPDELAQALRQGRPLIVMVSLEGCPFCRRARQSHLAPMQREGTTIVQVDMRSPQPVRDFEGQMTTHDALVQRWRVPIAPTLLFFGPGGREVAERMEGAYQPDFYGPYLDERLEKAAVLIRRS
jgi:thioredoxin-related protein